MYTKKKKTTPSNPPKPTVSEACQKLEEALRSIDSNENWMRFLRFESRFHRYSANNVLLIYAQRPEATYITGYRTWQRMDRYVRKGEHALRILAPLTYKSRDDDDGEDSYQIRGFHLVPVFDLSQTEGSEEHLPALVTGLRGVLEGDEALYHHILRIIDIPVSEADNLIPKGCYTLDPPLIQVRSSLSFTQKTKTLTHEYGHYLHQIRCFEEEPYDIAEVIAESAAYIVCCHLGIDTSEYSIPYLACWNQELKAFQAVTHKIQMIASEMIARIEDTARDIGSCP